VKEQEIVILEGDDCKWCKDAEKLLDDLGKKYCAIAITENEMGAAIAKKVCDGDSCMVVNGKPIRKPDKRKMLDVVLD
jgi:glutaredoxin